ncbi:MAG: hypothetical protein IPO80_03130 [Propionibacteriaceae bacterium]|nr:hypothetical protein [Propionibacteriaceae bacterium]
MEFMEWAQTKTESLGAWDLALIKWSCLAGGVLLAQMVPALGRIDKRVLAAVTVALALKPALSVLGATSSDPRRSA